MIEVQGLGQREADAFLAAMERAHVELCARVYEAGSEVDWRRVRATLDPSDASIVVFHHGNVVVTLRMPFYFVDFPGERFPRFLRDACRRSAGRLH